MELGKKELGRQNGTWKTTIIENSKMPQNKCTFVSGIQKKQMVRLPRQTHPYKKNVPPVPKLKWNVF